MDLNRILQSKLSYKEKESKISALFCFTPPQENKLDDQSESIQSDPLYRGLAQEALSTGFSDYYRIFKDLDGDLIDYGAGFCKGSFLFEYLDTTKKCYSYEYVAFRVDYAKQWITSQNLSCDSLFQRDLLKEIVPIGDNYLIYIPLGNLFFRLLYSLYQNKKKATFYVIESHGDILDYINALECMSFIGVLDSEHSRHKSGIFKYQFDPSLVKDTLYSRYFTSYDQKLELITNEDGRERRVYLDDTLPIFYNQKQCIELLSLKRICDGEIIKLVMPKLPIS